MRVHPFLLALTCVLAIDPGSCNTGNGVCTGSTQGTLPVVKLIANAAGPLYVLVTGHAFVTGLPC